MEPKRYAQKRQNTIFGQGPDPKVSKSKMGSYFSYGEKEKELNIENEKSHTRDIAPEIAHSTGVDSRTDKAELTIESRPLQGKEDASCLNGSLRDSESTSEFASKIRANSNKRSKIRKTYPVGTILKTGGHYGICVGSGEEAVSLVHICDGTGPPELKCFCDLELEKTCYYSSPGGGPVHRHRLRDILKCIQFEEVLADEFTTNGTLANPPKTIAARAAALVGYTDEELLQLQPREHGEKLTSKWFVTYCAEMQTRHGSKDRKVHVMSVIDLCNKGFRPLYKKHSSGTSLYIGLLKHPTKALKTHDTIDSEMNKQRKRLKNALIAEVQHSDEIMVQEVALFGNGEGPSEGEGTKSAESPEIPESIPMKIDRTADVDDDDDDDSQTRNTRKIPGHNKNELQKRNTHKSDIRLSLDDIEWLLDEHSNISVLEIDQRAGKVVISCIHKGFIPYGESRFPKWLGRLPVMINEDCVSFAIKEGDDLSGYTEELMMGISVGSKGSGHYGTLGGFFKTKEEDAKMGFLTCAHVLRHPDLNGVIPGPGHKVLSPFTKEQSQIDSHTCGVVPLENKRCFEPCDPSYFVDAAFVEVPFPNRLPKELKIVAQADTFPDALDFKEGRYTSLDDIPHTIVDSPKVYKLGTVSKFTEGTLGNNIVMNPFKVGDYPLQCRVRGLKVTNSTAYQGDSGSIAFTMDKDNIPSMLGLLFAVSDNSPAYYITPIDLIMQKLSIEPMTHQDLVALGGIAAQAGGSSPGHGDEEQVVGGQEGAYGGQAGTFGGQDGAYGGQGGLITGQACGSDENIHEVSEGEEFTDQESGFASQDVTDGISPLMGVPTPEARVDFSPSSGDSSDEPMFHASKDENGNLEGNTVNTSDEQNQAEVVQHSRNIRFNVSVGDDVFKQEFSF